MQPFETHNCVMYVVVYCFVLFYLLGWVYEIALCLSSTINLHSQKCFFFVVWIQNCIVDIFFLYSGRLICLRPLVNKKDFIFWILYCDYTSDFSSLSGLSFYILYFNLYVNTIYLANCVYWLYLTAPYGCDSMFLVWLTLNCLHHPVGHE